MTEDLGEVEEVRAALLAGCGVAAQPFGRSPTRWRVDASGGRGLLNPIWIDLHSPAAVTFLINQAASLAGRRDRDAARRCGVETFTFELAEAVWLSNQQDPGVSRAIRVEPDGSGGFRLTTAELDR